MCTHLIQHTSFIVSPGKTNHRVHTSLRLRKEMGTTQTRIWSHHIAISSLAPDCTICSSGNSEALEAKPVLTTYLSSSSKAALLEATHSAVCHSVCITLQCAGTTLQLLNHWLEQSLPQTHSLWHWGIASLFWLRLSHLTTIAAEKRSQRHSAATYRTGTVQPNAGLLHRGGNHTHLLASECPSRNQSTERSSTLSSHPFPSHGSAVPVTLWGSVLVLRRGGWGWGWGRGSVGVGVANALHVLGPRVEGAVRGGGGGVDVVAVGAGLAEGLRERGVGVVARGLTAQLALAVGRAGRAVGVTHVTLVPRSMTRRRGEGVPQLPLAVGRGLGMELTQLPLAVGRGKLGTHLLELQGWGRGLGPWLHKLLVKGWGRRLPSRVIRRGLRGGGQMSPWGQHGLRRHTGAGLKLLLLEARLLVVRGWGRRGWEVVKWILRWCIAHGAVVLWPGNVSLTGRAWLGRLTLHGWRPVVILLLLRTILCCPREQAFVTTTMNINNNKNLEHFQRLKMF